ncbi:hypothetical protein CQW23_28246 [Capsicum baccatum]|uniref:Pentatricopeptide repeat-containing protein n=1 Tax=Capsicum baccatum TaxID=33114 RepID=A0A2G2VG37_CAPBA|nr:hypothetical protein CQW23_28246 [Capsicum baccatum]
MLCGYAKNEWFCDVVDMFEAMSEKNVVYYNVMFTFYLGIGDFISAQKVFDKMVKRNITSWNVLVNGYAKMGRMRKACELFDEILVRNEVSYMIMILDCVVLGIRRLESVWDDEEQFDDVVIPIVEELVFVTLHLSRLLMISSLLPPNLDASIASNFSILSGSIHSIREHRQPALYKQHGTDTVGTNLKNL